MPSHAARVCSCSAPTSNPPLPQRLGELQLQLRKRATRARAQGLHAAMRCRCEPAALRAGAGSVRVCAPAAIRPARRGRQRIERLELVERRAAGAVSRLDLAASAARSDRLSGAAGRCAPLPPPSRPAARRRAAATRRAAKRNGPGCAPFARAIRRAAWPGKPMRAAHRCWWRTTMRPAGVHRLLDFACCATCRSSARLSQLAQWVLECERLGENYGLRLPASWTAGRATASRSAAPVSKPWRCTAYERARRAAARRSETAASAAQRCGSARGLSRRGAAECASHRRLVRCRWRSVRWPGVRARRSDSPKLPSRVVRIIGDRGTDARRAAGLSHSQRRRGRRRACWSRWRR